MDTLRLSSAVAALLIAGSAQALTGGMHLHSLHAPANDSDNNANRGLYIRTDQGLTMGMYRNTYRRLSPYVAQSFDFGQADLVLGVIGGYQRKGDAGFSRGYLSPLAAVSYAMPVQVMGVTPRLTLVPGHLVKARTVLHLSVERQF